MPYRIKRPADGQGSAPAEISSSSAQVEVIIEKPSLGYVDKTFYSVHVNGVHVWRHYFPRHAKLMAENLRKALKCPQS